MKSIGLTLPFPNQHYPNNFKDEIWPAVLQPVVRVNAQKPLLMLFCQVYVQVCHLAETRVLQFETAETIFHMTPSFIRYRSHSLKKQKIHLKIPRVC